MTVTEILQKVDNVSNETNYWFVRTDYGSLFEEFIKGNYIAIGWDYLTLTEISQLSELDIKLKISKAEEIDLADPSGKRKVTGIYNKIKTFISLRKNDIIVIPSRNSDRLAFGHVIDSNCYQDINAKSFYKKRDILWSEIKYMDDLNPIFFQVKRNQHTITNINQFSSHVDRVIGNLFRKGSNIHYILNIEKDDNISFDDLRVLIDDINKLSNNINQKFSFDEKSEDFFIKVNLQSKGSLELIKENGRTLAVLAYLLFVSSCRSIDSEQDREMRELINDNRNELLSTSRIIDSLKINTEMLAKTFGDGR